MFDITVIIFSKDRAMQLDGLLRSIVKYAPQYRSNLRVVYRTSYPESEKAYNILRSDWPCAAFLNEEFGGFKASTLCALDSGCHLTMMLVDDDLFYRPLPWFTVEPGTAYAPRLGYNCTVCYNGGGKPQKVPTKLWREVGGEGDLDFDCTLCLDGHVYLTEEILPYFQKANYSNPNEIEVELSGSIRPVLKFSEHSCLVGVPHNVVSVYNTNRQGGEDPVELNRLFLAGKHMDLDAMDFGDIVGVHQIVPYKFR